ncbi:MAG: SUMF1/EgtB/PvdO family nonheme iron enzyme [Bacteroidota bacterium]
MLRIITVLILLFNLAWGNNIQIENVRLVDQNTADDYYFVEFDLSWENSWRTSTFESNYDAAWVFVKFTPKNQQEWTHATLHYVNGTNDGHLAPSGATINTTSDGVGVFIYRDSDGIGNVNYQNVRLRWDYGTNGVADDEVLEISVFAVEMVYVPQGAFYAGDGQQDFGQFEAGNSGQPFQITSEAAITLGGTNLNNMSNNDAINMLNDDDFNYTTTQTLPADFPKGYDAFYCMKYEGSQQQYADFLAHITYDQRLNNDGPLYVNAVNVFPIEDGNHYAVAEHPWRAMDYLSWPNIAAFLDWSGLRPLSELEYEKACRGPETPVNNELAWGDDSWYIEGFYSLQNEGTPTETITDLGENVGNANTHSIYSGADSPMRCGIFAASATNKTRKETGATYWGIMEMSGNCYEPVISVGNSQTRDFSGRHGNGNITSTGNASFVLLSDWAFVNTVGVGFRTSEISTRYQANYNDADRAKWIGIRGVRTAE